MLKSLDENNAERQAAHRCARDEEMRPKPNGIACPTCGVELVDDQPYRLFTNGLGSCTTVWCEGCNYRGTRFI